MISAKIKTDLLARNEYFANCLLSLGWILSPSLSLSLSLSLSHSLSMTSRRTIFDPLPNELALTLQQGRDELVRVLVFLDELHQSPPVSRFQ